MASYRQILVDGAPVGMQGLDAIFEALKKENITPHDQCITEVLIERVGRDNYIPYAARDTYAAALSHEYATFLAREGSAGVGKNGHDRNWRGIPREQIPWYPIVDEDLRDGCARRHRVRQGLRDPAFRLCGWLQLVRQDVQAGGNTLPAPIHSGCIPARVETRTAQPIRKAVTMESTIPASKANAPVISTELATLFKALAHPKRLAILETLRDTERCVYEIEEALDLRQAYVSQQLTVLRETGLVCYRKEGWNVYYRIARSEVYTLLEMATAIHNDPGDCAVVAPAEQGGPT